MTNPIPSSVRGWIYVAGIVVGLFVAVVLPDLLTALEVGERWVTLGTRASGALTVLLGTLGRANLSPDADLKPPNPGPDVLVPSGQVPDLPPDAQIIAGVQDDLGTYNPERAAP